jgi:signal transduction histidine kinase
MARTTGQKEDSKEAPESGQESGTGAANFAASTRELKRRLFDFHTILELSKNLNSVLDLKSLVNSFLGVLVSQLRVRRAAVFQRQSRQTRKFVLTNWVDVEHFAPRSQFEENSETVRNLIENMSVISTKGMSEAIGDKYEKSFLENFDPGLVVPLKVNWGLNGILFAGPKVDSAEFTAEDGEFLLLLCGQMAVALENARLHEVEKRAIADLQATQEQLVHTERLAALGEMSAKIAHEINNPLGIIKNYLMLLKKAEGDKPESLKYVNIVGQEIDRITGIVKELLQFHRPQSIDFRKINVLSVIEEVLAFMAPQLAQAKITFSRKFSPNSPIVEGSAENLRQVFMNLLLNAVDAMPTGGQISVETLRSRNNLLIRFQDTGPGVADELLPKMFDPFFTTKGEGKGTGLGLSVSYGIIKKHNGTIIFKNTNQGGCVEITLPSAEATDD